MTETEFPADVEALATSIAEAVSVRRYIVDKAELIAEAIMAERRRCADVYMGFLSYEDRAHIRAAILRPKAGGGKGS